MQNFKQRKKNFDFILGTRAETYDISGKTIDLTTGKLTKDLIPFKNSAFSQMQAFNITLGNKSILH